ncbi:MmcQ/YjbR family DNA-binding protein, partial [Escherichia coli]|nr:MmcQ/YjbR family DNA-binding protein [Escherichia coli]
MTLDDYNRYCAGLPHTSHVVQWGESHVWKVGGKVFAIASTWNRGPDNLPHVTFKTSDMSFDMLRDQDGCRPAPYLASRGMKW